METITLFANIKSFSKLQSTKRKEAVNWLKGWLGVSKLSKEKTAMAAVEETMMAKEMGMARVQLETTMEPKGRVSSRR